MIACLLLIQSACLHPVFAETTTSEGIPKSTDQETAGHSKNVIESFRKISYDTYIEKYKNMAAPNEEILIGAAGYSYAQGMQPEVLDPLKGTEKKSLKTGEEGFVEWEFHVDTEGLYNMSILYFPVEGKDSAIERELWIDGEIPFEGARTLVFQRVWKNGEEVKKDPSGNEYRPYQVESPMWQEAPVSGITSFNDENYKFYFSKGKHTIRLVSVKEPMIIEHIRLYNEEEVASYVAVTAQYNKLGYKSVSSDTKIIKIQGEDAVLKSDSILYPLEDHSSPANEPFSVSKIRMNTIGGYNWRYPGQWLVWEFDVEKEGLYKIGFRAKQDFKSGIFANRRLYIDGKVPFKEAETIQFKYGMGWQMVKAGEDEPCLFYLTKGKHQLKMEVTLGDIGSIIRPVEDCVRELNYIYRKILMITGSFPDPLRDYNIDSQLPESMEIFERQSKLLTETSKKLSEMTGKKGQESFEMEKLATQLNGFIKNPDTIPERLAKFNDNISALGMWILTVAEQPLTIDYLVIAPPEAQLPRGEVSWWEKIVHEMKAFVVSFFENYNIVGDVNTDSKDNPSTNKSKPITLWLGVGRDQAQVLKSLIDNNFTSETGVQVGIRLVDMSVMLRAVAAGEGPDLAIYQDQATPVNYALRSALQDLSEFPDIDEVLKRFSSSAVEPFRIGNSVYALPEQQWFDMMFYRKDILADLGVEPPQTWDDLYKLIPVLQKNHLEIGLPTPFNATAGGTINSIFTTFLYQKDGEIYSQDKSRCILNHNTGVDAFTRWLELYTKYKIPQMMDILTRFRVGEAPIIISPYVFYNSIVVGAPEIKGLWEMAPIPGTRHKDGTIRRDEGGNVTGTIMLKNAKDKEATWEFMKWWTSSDTQVKYGREMEALQGPSARWPTANIDAMWKLPWSAKDAKSIREQWQWVKAVPEIPGGYYTGRNIDNAIRTVVIKGENPRETLLDYVKMINDEIILKRKEFGME